MSIEVKLNAVILPHDHKVYKLFPGKDYKHYTKIKDSGVVFLDVQDLEKISTDKSKWKADALVTHIATDRVARAVAKGKPQPSRLVRSQGDKATATFIQGLLFTAKKGDLVLVPDRGYGTDVLIGQFLDDPGTIVKVGGDLVGEPAYFGRRVKWLKGAVKGKFSNHLIKLLHSQAAFFDIGRSLYEEVYLTAFDDFVYDQQFFAIYRTSKSIFTPKDNFLTSVWMELLEVLEYSRSSHEDLASGSIYDLVIESNIADSDRDDLSISVQSPGWFRIRSIVAAPLAALSLFAMAANAVPYDDAVVAKSSANVISTAESSCLGDVDASVHDYVVLLGKERWEQACVLAQRAKAQAQLSAGATVIERTDGKAADQIDE